MDDICVANNLMLVEDDAFQNLPIHHSPISLLYSTDYMIIRLLYSTDYMIIRLLYSTDIQ